MGYGGETLVFFLLLRRKLLSENICKVNFAQYGSIKYIVAPVLSPKLTTCQNKSLFPFFPFMHKDASFKIFPGFWSFPVL